MEEKKMQNEVHIKIGTDGIEFDAKGDSDFIERERNAFEAKLLPLGVDAVTRTRNVVQTPPMITANEFQSLPQTTYDPSEVPTNNYADWSRIGLASFIKQKGAENNNEFILCATYFNEKKNGISSFSSLTAKEFYSEVKKPLPSNVSMAINQLVSKGLIMENPSAKGANPKEYILTSDGERYVEELQPKEEQSKKPTSKPRKARPKADSQYSDINIDDLNCCNYADIKLLKSSKEKMMAILYMVTNEKKGEWFTVTDVACLMTDIFGESVGNQTIIDLFSKNKTWFKSEKVEGTGKEKRHKLLNGGIEFAKKISTKAEETI